jgi:DNA (cytosine-5)-methyltransferase 1
MITFGSLFAGIGGLDLGLERASMTCKWQVEIDPFCRKVLQKHWPNVPKYEDVRNVGKHNLEPVDLIAGGFPCQDISEANANGKGLEGELSGLWWQFRRIIGELQPRYAIVENVANITNRGIGAVLGSLATIGYDAEWQVVSACAFGAPHTRARMYFVAYPNSQRLQASRQEGSIDGPKVFWGTENTQYLYPSALSGGSAGWTPWSNSSGMARMDDGVPDRVDRNHALGNAVVPQVAQWLGERILDTERGLL